MLILTKPLSQAVLSWRCDVNSARLETAKALFVVPTSVRCGCAGAGPHAVAAEGRGAPRADIFAVRSRA